MRREKKGTIVAHTVGLLISGKLKTQQKAVHKPTATSVLLLATLSVNHKLLVLNINLILRELDLLGQARAASLSHTHTDLIFYCQCLLSLPFTIFLFPEFTKIQTVFLCFPAMKHPTWEDYTFDLDFE